MEPKLTKLEYFALMIGAQLDSTYDDIWVDKAIRRAQLLIDELDKVENNSTDVQ